MVVEGDGDEYQGSDRWQSGMNRQRILERAAWVFWRCCASTWTMRKGEVVFELCQQLDAMGIEPLGSLERTSSLVEKRVWRPPIWGGSLLSESEEDIQGRARSPVSAMRF
jgi:hypothetical protein